MFRQIIRPETKADLIIHLPEKYLGKEVEVEANEVKPTKHEMRVREKALKKAFEFFNTISVDMSEFKFNREEANER